MAICKNTSLSKETSHPVKILIIVVVLVLLALGLRLSIPRMGSSVAGGIITSGEQHELADCPDTPNCYRDSFPIEAEPSLAIETMAAIVDSQAGTHTVTRNEQYLHVTWSTPLMGFVDDVEFLVRQPSADEPPILQVRSASRLGKSDLGANAKRVAMLRSVSAGRL